MFGLVKVLLRDRLQKASKDQNWKAPDCSFNQIEKFQNFPETLGSLWCISNHVKKMEYLPEALAELRCEVDGIKNPKDLPQSLKVFDRSSNQFEKLENLPDKLKSLRPNFNDFEKSENLAYTLISFSCDGNDITKLEGVKGLEIRCNQTSKLDNQPPFLTYQSCTANDSKKLGNLPQYLLSTNTKILADMSRWSRKRHIAAKVIQKHCQNWLSNPKHPRPTLLTPNRTERRPMRSEYWAEGKEYRRWTSKTDRKKAFEWEQGRGCFMTSRTIMGMLTAAIEPVTLALLATACHTQPNERFGLKDKTPIYSPTALPLLSERRKITVGRERRASDTGDW
ncbi:hypothetical protein BDK51DRAFT_29137 [Blyttiomyces helicus]|uniref:Uncharacterized protein n=1 Tax=Blyttiomyces helicus TaxID=388810 RepID=A0A4P9WPH2_9FUNG|nr:hypothetical protein BDK51DRAFT_29137 [Blyttiomyces helicus]|eukprot:RKO94225.1 hypothetical protein BDK51DRAFT_29137 [Blyttiomyces helicus]